MDKRPEKKKRQRWRGGDVIQIDLGQSRFGFGLVIKYPLIAFFDLCATETPPLDAIIGSPIAFKVWVMKYAITKGIWPIIGHIELTEVQKSLPVFFKQDAPTGELSLYYMGGYEEPAAPEQIKGLERAAVWDPEHVVDRLNDHFAGQPNKWVESLKPDLRRVPSS